MTKTSSSITGLKPNRNYSSFCQELIVQRRSQEARRGCKSYFECN